MASWWHRDMIAAGKLPLMLCFLAFVVTFVLTRTITRMIRDGRGPFRNQVTPSGTHIHHSVPGIILLIIGAFTAVGGPDSLGWRSFAGVAVGIGTSLVLDEFALILHLQDVYRAVTAPDRNRDPHRRRRARLHLRAERQVPDGTVRALPATRRGDRRSAPRAPVIDLGTPLLPGQAPGTRDPTRRRLRSALGPAPDRLGRLRRRETVPAEPAGRRRRPPLNPGRHVVTAAVRPDRTARWSGPGSGPPWRTGPRPGRCRWRSPRRRRTAGSYWAARGGCQRPLTKRSTVRGGCRVIEVPSYVADGASTANGREAGRSRRATWIAGGRKPTLARQSSYGKEATSDPDRRPEGERCRVRDQ
jgi:hypothetical protein